MPPGKKGRRLNVYNYFVESASCPLCGGAVAGYGVRYGHLPVHAGSTMWTMMVYRCNDCGMASQYGRIPEHALSGNGETWPMKVSRGVTRFARWGSMGLNEGVVAAGKNLRWIPWGGWAIGRNEYAHVAVTAVVSERGLRWRRRDTVSPTWPWRHIIDVPKYADYDSFQSAVQTSVYDHLALTILQHQQPKLKLLG